MAEYVCDMTDDYPDIPYGADEYSGTLERRERVVRCRDCAHSRREGRECWRFVDDPDEDFERIAIAAPDGFCAWGVRKEES